MSKIAILGGTFNPIHLGHIMLAKQCQEQLAFDRILIIPTNRPPHKHANGLCSNEDRFEMCRLAVKGDPVFEVSDVEYRLGGTSYTFNTILTLRKEYPGASFYLLVGSDMYFTFRKWRHYREILNLCTLVGASRSPEEHERMLETKRSLQTDGYETIVIENEVLEISSTELRERLKAGTDVSGFLAPEVERYIREHGLYLGDAEERE